MRFLAALALLLLVPAPAAAEPTGPAEPFVAAPTDVIVHLFQWPWASVADECVQVLGPKGFGACRCRRRRSTSWSTGIRGGRTTSR